MLIDVNGKQETITEVISGIAARRAQISTNHLQININNATGIQMPESAFNHLLNGGAVTVSGNRYSNLKV